MDNPAALELLEFALGIKKEEPEPRGTGFDVEEAE
jgi:hypothetical protein